jgi:hypothetical protein
MREKRKANGRLLFRALQQEIKAELDAGVFVVDVHAKYQQQLAIGYSQFMKYVKLYQLRSEASVPPPPAPAVHGTPSSSASATQAEATPRPVREPIKTVCLRPDRHRPQKAYLAVCDVNRSCLGLLVSSS